MDIDESGRGGDEVGLVAALAQPFEQADGVDRACRAGDADDDAPAGVGRAQAATPSAGCSSPASYISVMMSEPPTNSPLT